MLCYVCKKKQPLVFVVPNNEKCREGGHYVHVNCYPGNLSRGAGTCFVCQSESLGLETVNMDSGKNVKLVDYSSDDSSGNETDVSSDDEASNGANEKVVEVLMEESHLMEETVVVTAKDDALVSPPTVGTPANEDAFVSAEAVRTPANVDDLISEGTVLTQANNDALVLEGTIVTPANNYPLVLEGVITMPANDDASVSDGTLVTLTDIISTQVPATQEVTGAAGPSGSTEALNDVEQDDNDCDPRRLLRLVYQNMEEEGEPAATAVDEESTDELDSSDPEGESLERSAGSVYHLTCQTCKKVFKTTSGKSKCENKHMGPYWCSCGRQFQRQESLKRHEKVCKRQSRS